MEVGDAPRLKKQAISGGVCSEGSEVAKGYRRHSAENENLCNTKHIHRETKQSPKGIQAASRMTPLFMEALAD